MTLQKFICWKPDRINDVVKTDAEGASDPEFLAVHSDYELAIGDDYPKAAQASRLTPQKNFIEDFLSPEKVNNHVAVIGTSGSGKSHLIKWMRLNIENAEQRIVFSIPRTQVSLRSILENIIQLLPENEQSDYLEILNRSGGEIMTRPQRRLKFVHAVATAIRESAPAAIREVAPDERQRVQWMHAGLADMFDDPYVVTKTTVDGSFIDRLSEHIFEPNSEYERRENSYEFDEEDLPLLGTDMLECSLPVRKFLQQMGSLSDSRPKAVKIVNDCLDFAIQRSLEFSGDRLIQLMMDVRRSLGKKGVQLILLIEDLARLQGIDHALLQALTVYADDSDLCDMRWAAAITDGYYTTMEETFTTRVDKVVDMDRSAVRLKNKNVNDSLSEFAVKYLSATRTDSKTLKDWSLKSNRDAAPNPCDKCEFQLECFETFGQVDERGLYPFTEHALENMTSRAGAITERGFNPRFLLKSVLRPVLESHSEIREGAYPDLNLVSSMGGHRLPIMFRQQLGQETSSTTGSVEALYELYAQDPTVPTSIREEVWNVFGIPMPDITATPVVAPPSDERNDPPPSTAPVLSEKDKIVLALENWSSGTPMASGVSSELRPMVMEWIQEVIDWNQLGLARSRYIGSSGALRPAYITFRNQVSKGRPAGADGITLQLPLSDSTQDLLNTALALQGMRKFTQSGDWNFDDALSLYPRVVEELEKWKNHVIGLIHQATAADSGWNAAESALELLAIGAVANGRFTKSNISASELISEIFTEWPEPDANRTHDWKELCERISSEKSRLVDLVHSTHGSGKGRSVSSLDPSKVQKILKRIVKKWELEATPPEVSDQWLLPEQNIAKSWAWYVQKYKSALNSEFLGREDWIDRVETAFGEDFNKTTMVADMKRLENKVRDSGLSINTRIINRFSVGLSGLDGAHIDAAFNMAKSITNDQNSELKFPHLGISRGLGAIGRLDEFIEVAGEFVSECESSIALEKSTSDAGSSSLNSNLQVLRTALQGMQTSLTTLGGKTQ